MLSNSDLIRAFIILVVFMLIFFGGGEMNIDNITSDIIKRIESLKDNSLGDNLPEIIFLRHLLLRLYILEAEFFDDGR